MWYAFNPLVIVEVTGNLHFEGLMVLFILLALLLRERKKPIKGALSIGAAVATKLVPAIFLPVWLRDRGLAKGVLYIGVALALATLSFIPFMSAELLQNVGSSVDLYFRSFEFNASIYYLARQIGFWITGYNQIAWIGPLLSSISFVAILALSWRKNAAKDLAFTFILVLTVYLFLTTTVHPWYVVTLVALTVLTDLRYPLLWS
ncbi:MAG: DUF2029 domain-containing protein, partial [Flavobacteriales bacterium]|nr:DUF2029 domain-containing protein [Flavobacteriales bacterium]